MLPKILVVDDEKEFCNSISAFLVKNNFNVINRFTCEEALLLLREDFFDIIICDVFLPFFGSQDSVVQPQLPCVSPIRAGQVSVLTIDTFPFAVRPADWRHASRCPCVTGPQFISASSSSPASIGPPIALFPWLPWACVATPARPSPAGQVPPEPTVAPWLPRSPAGRLHNGF